MHNLTDIFVQREPDEIIFFVTVGLLVILSAGANFEFNLGDRTKIGDDITPLLWGECGEFCNLGDPIQILAKLDVPTVLLFLSSLLSVLILIFGLFNKDNLGLSLALYSFNVVLENGFFSKMYIKIYNLVKVNINQLIIKQVKLNNLTYYINLQIRIAQSEHLQLALRTYLVLLVHRRL